MSQPTPYDRQTSFTLAAVENPETPYTGSELDAEFNAIKVTLDETLANLERIQRDDGDLGNQTVGPEQLAASLTIGINPPTAWESGESYALYDTVFEGTVLYKCIVAHTSTSSFSDDFTAGKWEILAEFNVVAIEDGSVTTAKLATDAVTTVKIEDDAVTSAKIVALAITTAKIASGAVTSDKLAAGAIATAKIQDEAITADKLGTDAVITAKVQNGAITADKLGADAVTAAKIGDDVINSEHYAAASIDTEHIADAQVTLAKMASIATASFIGRTTASTGVPEVLSATQATALLNAMVGDSGSGGTKGLAPAPAAGDAAAGKFLRADGTWASAGGMVLLNSGVISVAQAQLDIVLTSYTGYRGLILKLVNFRPSNDNVALSLFFSSNGGSSFDATGYAWSGLAGSNASANSIDLMMGAGNLSNDSDERISSSIEILGQADGTRHTRAKVETWGYSASGGGTFIYAAGAGSRAATQDTDAIRVKTASGNISAVTWALYGLL